MGRGKRYHYQWRIPRARSTRDKEIEAERSWTWNQTKQSIQKTIRALHGK